MTTIRKIVTGAFVAIAVLASLGVCIAYVATWIEWLGALGGLIGLVTSPGVVVFPFIYWAVEHEFPVLYFALWTISIVAMALAGAVFSEDEHP